MNIIDLHSVVLEVVNSQTMSQPHKVFFVHIRRNLRSSGNITPIRQVYAKFCLKASYYRHASDNTVNEANKAVCSVTLFQFQERDCKRLDSTIVRVT